MKRKQLVNRGQAFPNRPPRCTKTTRLTSGSSTGKVKARHQRAPTGQRHISHAERGNRMLLFAREFKQDSVLSNAAAYAFLGTANYVKHEGSRPMSITWELDEPIPAKFLQKTDKLVVG